MYPRPTFTRDDRMASSLGMLVKKVAASRAVISSVSAMFFPL